MAPEAVICGVSFSLAVPDVGYGAPISPLSPWTGDLLLSGRFAAGGRSDPSLSKSDSVVELARSKSCSASFSLLPSAFDPFRLRLLGLLLGLELPLTYVPRSGPRPTPFRGMEPLLRLGVFPIPVPECL
jgi:hypothetical protein